MRNEIKEIKTLLKTYCDQYDEFILTIRETILSTVIIIEDKESSYEEVVVISDQEVHIISEGVEYTKLALSTYYQNVKDNYGVN